MPDLLAEGRGTLPQLAGGLPSLSGRELTIEPLGGGLTNCVVQGNGLFPHMTPLW